MHKGLFATLIYLLLGASAHATTLVTPTGQPVGGQWQAWTDAALAPSGPATTPFSTDPATIGQHCLGAEWTVYLACTADWTYQSGSDPATMNNLFVGVLPANPRQGYRPTGTVLRQNLYKELGQVFDATMLTDQDRIAFERIFPHANHRCDSCTTVQDLWDYSPTGGESSYAEWFGEGWRLCATFGTLTAKDASSSLFTISGGYPVQWADPRAYPYSPSRGRNIVDHRRQHYALEQQQRVCQLIAQAAAHGPTLLPSR